MPQEPVVFELETVELLGEDDMELESELEAQEIVSVIFYFCRT